MQTLAHFATPLAMLLLLIISPTTSLPLRLPIPSQNQRPFIAPTWTPTENHPIYRAPLSSYPHPSPLATATPFPSKPQQQEQQQNPADDDEEEQPIPALICNLGHRTPLSTEDAVEIAYALCQGGIMDRSVVEGRGGVGTEEVLECLACEWGSWNEELGRENKG